ncbi:MAG TPA: glycoside hydrolase family protein [Opitutaceae bacterium]|nr:glycoside hydrolase family protein [Opitutaceae bacterium]
MKFPAAALALVSFAAPLSVSAQDLIDFFRPTPITSPLTSQAWGLPGVLPRDVDNGLEDKANKSWSYWDGKILKGPDGRYHLFASRWPEKDSHWAWGSSVAIHAVSNNVLGPYTDLGPLFADHDGKGHNVTALQLPDGRYAVLLSETRPGDVYIASSLDGPWEYHGSIQYDREGFTDRSPSNWSIVARPEGGFLIVTRHGLILLSTGGIMGPYKVQGKTIYPDLPGLDLDTAEDPVIWYSGGRYHIVVNWWNARKAYHLTSTDGIHDWKLVGLAYDPQRDFIRYTDGTVNRWTKLERPGVVVEDGHVTHFTFAVIDSQKEDDKGGDNHGSKIVVVPFDGAAFDAALAAR